MLRLAVKNEDRRILVVDDDDQIIEIINLCLASEGYQFKSTMDPVEALSLIHSWKPHVVILDVNLPLMSGIEALKKIRQENEYISVIFLSGRSATDEVVTGLDAGADDYICKPFVPEELLARVRTQLRIKDLNDELRKANEMLKELSETDDLTGLFNMRSLYSRLEHEIQRGRRYKRTVCVVMMDMDKFKSVNDAHDHLFGSFVLSEVGKIIKQTIRTVDIAARYGGDEFLMVLTEVDRPGAILFCERLRERIENYNFELNSDKMKLTASIGFSITDPQNGDIDTKQLVRIADRALYDSKHKGRNQVCFYDLSEQPHLAHDKSFKSKKAL